MVTVTAIQWMSTAMTVTRRSTLGRTKYAMAGIVTVMDWLMKVAQIPVYALKR
jgi:hypothetical protein